MSLPKCDLVANIIQQMLEEYSNASTKVKGAKSLLKDYEELSGKIYRTAEEQAKLNDLAQQLGDSLEVEVIEDQYGNLSVSIDIFSFLAISSVF